MKLRFARVVWTCVALTGCATSRAREIPSDVDTIRASGEAWFAAERRRDIESIMPYVTDEAVFQPPDAPSFSGRAAIREFYRKLYDVPFSDIGGKSDRVIVAASGDIAYDVGQNYIVLKGRSGDTRLTGKYLAVWRKTGSTWRVTAISWSLDAPMK